MSLLAGKKDAEGWETVQRGRPARPRSAAIVAKVSPVLANVCPRDDSNIVNQPQQQQPKQQQKQALQPLCPPDNDKSQLLSNPQPIPEEQAPLEETGDLEEGHKIEVLLHDDTSSSHPGAVLTYQ